MNWVDKHEEKVQEERSKDYFSIEEGVNQFVLLTHCAPLAQMWNPSTKKYEIAQEGATGVSIKGVCWVLQDGDLKQAKLPYSVVKSIRAIQQDPEWDFTFPFPHTLSLTAKGAKTKEVEYNLTPSPKKVEIPKTILDELAKKPSPDEIIEKIKNAPAKATAPKTYEYPTEDINPEDIPF